MPRKTSLWLKFDKVLYRLTLVTKFDVSHEKTDYRLLGKVGKGGAMIKL